MLPHCWSLQSHVANTDPPLVPVKNNFSSVYWTGKSQYLGQIRDHLIGVGTGGTGGEKWIYIIGAAHGSCDRPGLGSYKCPCFTFLQTSSDVVGGREF